MVCLETFWNFELKDFSMALGMLRRYEEREALRIRNWKELSYHQWKQIKYKKNNWKEENGNGCLGNSRCRLATYVQMSQVSQYANLETKKKTRDDSVEG